MNKYCIVFGAALSFLASTTGCGGRTTSIVDDEGGPLASCGDNCSPAQVSASCATICDNIEQSGCKSGMDDDADCVSSCSQLPAMGSACASQAYAFLRCIEGMQPTCASGATALFAGCDAEQQAVSTCLGTSSSTQPTSPGTGGSAPSSDCPGIPLPWGRTRARGAAPRHRTG